MKRWKSFLFVSLFVFILAACGTNDDNTASNDAEDKDTTEDPVTLKVGASYGVHELILEQAKPILAKEGIDLEIELYQDYVMPNQDLDSGEIDANYFQHIPYLEEEMESKGYDFVNAGGIHIEPMGIYSKKYKSLDELPDGAEIIISNSVTDRGRILMFLENQGLITLRDDINKVNATIDDIVENPKNLVFQDENNSPAPEMLVTLFNEGEGDAVAINSNFAIDAGINPLEDSIAIENSESPYVNVVAVRAEDKDNEAIKKLVEVLHSKEIQDFILDEWKGAVVPVSE